LIFKITCHKQTKNQVVVQYYEFIHGKFHSPNVVKAHSVKKKEKFNASSIHTTKSFVYLK